MNERMNDHMSGRASGADLLERRAERGVPSGAANVWGDAVLRSAEPHSGSLRTVEAGPTLWFRLTMAAVAAVIVGAIVLPGQAGWRLGEIDPADEQPVLDAEDTSSKPWILIDGMQLVRVHGPRPQAAPDASAVIIPDEDGADLIARSQLLRRAIFVADEEPFDSPLLYAELFADGTIALGSTRLNSDELLPDFDAVFEDGKWTLLDAPANYDLIVDLDLRQEQLATTTQLDFEDGSDTATVQIEMDPGAGVWSWLARLGTSVVPMGYTEVEVLGNPGVRVSDALNNVDQVIWTGDGQLYRLTAGEIDGDTALPRQTAPVVPQLREVSDAELAAAVESIPSPSMIWTVLLLLGAAWLVARAAWDGEWKQAFSRIVCVGAFFVLFAPINPTIWSVLLVGGLFLFDVVQDRWPRKEPAPIRP